MRLIFAGTPTAAVPSLDRLAEGPHEVAVVVTRPPAPVGRKRIVTPSPVGARAAELGLPLLEASRIGPAETERLVATEADLGVVVAYGALLRPPALAAPRLGWINLHFSLLPRWRGAAPVQWTLLAGDEQAGISVFRLEEGLDTGPLLARTPVPIPPDATAGDLLALLADRGADVLAKVVDDLAGGTATSTPQDGEVTLAPKPTQDDARVRWAEPAPAVLGRIRGTTPEPGAWAELPDGTRLKLLAATSGSGPALEPGALHIDGGRLLVGTATDPVALLEVQAAGRARTAAPAWARGARVDRLL
jgi:methionyl-tRNA formyltransferase